MIIVSQVINYPILFYLVSVSIVFGLLMYLINTENKISKEYKRIMCKYVFTDSLYGEGMLEQFTKIVSTILIFFIGLSMVVVFGVIFDL